MIGKLTGGWGGTTPEGLALIEVGGVGYAVRTPLPALLALQASTPTNLSLFIHTAVRDDAIDLYGFPTLEELSFFKQLMSVSGIGPKTALNVMSGAEVATLKQAIASGDAAKLTKVFGIGKKSAERMVVELRDKLADEISLAGGSMASGTDSEVIEALMALGYRTDEARGALKEISKIFPAEASVHEKLAGALKYLGPTLKAS
jgi:Holliday junction DNA helicase RuvA